MYSLVNLCGVCYKRITSQLHSDMYNAGTGVHVHVPICTSTNLKILRKIPSQY